MADDDIYCARCPNKILGKSILRKKGELPTYNVLITKFTENKLGKQSDTLNLCDECMVAFEKFIKELKKRSKIEHE